MKRDERLINKFSRIYPILKLSADAVGFPVQLGISILFVEHQQYRLFNISCAIKAIKNKLMKIDSFNKVTGQYLKLSCGYAHIKSDTALRANQFFPVRPELISVMNKNDQAAIVVMWSILKAFELQWKPCYPAISEDYGILATLYNISAFDKEPHENPKIGGSELPLYIDGKLYEKMSFGERVVKVMKSETLKKFMKEHDD